MDKFEAIKFRYDQAFARGSTSTAVQDIGQLLNELNRLLAIPAAAEAEAHLRASEKIDIEDKATKVEAQLAECKDKLRKVLLAQEMGQTAQTQIGG